MKRQYMPKSWPIPRKGTAYIVKSKNYLEKSLPILIALRDMLKIATTKREVKQAIHLKNILINEKPIKNEKGSLTLFDVLTIVPSKKNYKLTISKLGKLELKEIDGNEKERKISKIINKKILKGKKTQINLSDGRNFISDLKCNTNDSIIIDFKKDKKISCLPLKEGAKVFIFEGKHSGEEGKIIKIDREKKMAELTAENKKINVLIKQLMVIE